MFSRSGIGASGVKVTGQVAERESMAEAEVDLMLATLEAEVGLVAAAH